MCLGLMAQSVYNEKKTTVQNINFSTLNIEKKIKDILREEQFEFRKGEGTRDTIGMLRIISEWTLEIDEELCVCFIDWQNAFDQVKWTKLMQILKGTGIDWRERRLISNLYMAQRVEVWLNQKKTEVWRLDEESDKDAVRRQFCSTCTLNALLKKLWKGLETSK